MFKIDAIFLQLKIKELKDENKALQGELQDQRSILMMTKMRAETQEELDRRELRQVKHHPRARVAPHRAASMRREHPA